MKVYYQQPAIEVEQIDCQEALLTVSGTLEDDLATQPAKANELFGFDELNVFE